MKKSKFLILSILFSMLMFSSCETLNALLGTLDGSQKAFSNDEAIQALKKALNVGAKSASSQLGAENGYFGNTLLKIFLPPEADIIIDNIDKIPFGQKMVDDVILRINRSAENAAKEVVPIFADAIREMTIKDGIEIVYGDNRAATTYLKNKTYTKLVNLFAPKMQASLSKPLVMGVSANAAWTKLVKAYNIAGALANKTASIMGQEEPMPPITADLAEFATGKALDGLFYKVGEEEGKIRKDPFDYASAIIQKVFGAVKNNL
ncbi:MAG: hypothetical protein CR988_04140 [Treponema sp.]|nr:MAG: hypothetical protein CR988_04140 [Treponema sp.]